MSDQPDLPTFWFKCPRGHVEERPMPVEGGRTLCGAQVVRTHEGGIGIYSDSCGEEMGHLGPTVAEWRAANDAIVEAKHEGRRQVEHRERMLVEADAALAACSAQLDDALTSAQTTRAREAEAEVRRLRGELENATQAAWINREAAAREAARRLRRERAWGADPEGLDEDDEEHASSDLAAELARRLGQCERDRQAEAARADEWRVKAQTEQAGRLEAERHVAHHHRQAGRFTLVRDVNGQTEAALRKAERQLRELRSEAHNRRREVNHWQMVALWANEHEPVSLPVGSYAERVETLSATYEGEMEDDSR